MSAHVADGADAPICPAAPIEGVIDGMVVHVGGGSAKKKIPGEAARNGVVAAKGGGQARVDVAAAPLKRFGAVLQRRGARDALRPKAEWAIRPDVDFAHVADGASPNVFDGGASFVRRVTLVAHLRDDFGFFSAAGKHARFFHPPTKPVSGVSAVVQVAWPP